MDSDYYEVEENEQNGLFWDNDDEFLIEFESKHIEDYDPIVPIMPEFPMLNFKPLSLIKKFKLKYNSENIYKDVSN